MNSRRLDVEDKNMHEHKAPVSQALIPMGATRLPFNKRVMELKKSNLRKYLDKVWF